MLYIFVILLSQVIGFDSVDDESKPENPLFDKDVYPPAEWDDIENPPYGYYQYYTYANMTVLNHFRAYVDIKFFYSILSNYFITSETWNLLIENKAWIHLSWDLIAARQGPFNILCAVTWWRRTFRMAYYSEKFPYSNICITWRKSASRCRHSVTTHFSSTITVIHFQNILLEDYV